MRKECSSPFIRSSISVPVSLAFSSTLDTVKYGCRLPLPYWQPCLLFWCSREESWPGNSHWARAWRRIVNHFLNLRDIPNVQIDYWYVKLHDSSNYVCPIMAWGWYGSSKYLISSSLKVTLAASVCVIHMNDSKAWGKRQATYWWYLPSYSNLSCQQLVQKHHP